MNKAIVAALVIATIAVATVAATSSPANAADIPEVAVVIRSDDNTDAPATLLGGGAPVRADRTAGGRTC